MADATLAPLPAPTLDELEGRALYGETLTPEQIVTWFADEEEGFFRLKTEYYEEDPPGTFEFSANDNYYFYRHIGQRTFAVCLALGCADGGDVTQLAPRVGRFIAIEPAEKWWTDQLGGKPAEFRRPALDGRLDLPDGSVDLITVFNVLHHIPNVSAIFAELARVLKPGGVMLLREPVVSMDDFRRPRPGLTAHERGIPVWFLEDLFARHGLHIRRKSVAWISPMFKILSMAGISRNNRAVVMLDDWLSRLLRFNVHYWRHNLWQRIGPHVGLFILEKA